jgi:putative glutamine amidotransferase
MESGPAETIKPLIGVLCCNEFAERPVQVVASRFIDPLATISDAAVLIVPALVNSFDAGAIAHRLDGLLLTGSRSNVAAERYGGSGDSGIMDPERDEIALRLADIMIGRGKPVFGICRGLQELNVLFGGTLCDLQSEHHQRDADASLQFHELFEHMHDIDLLPGGLLVGGGPGRRISVNSVHLQGVEELGVGLTVEAVSSLDGLVEAFSARPGGAQVLAVQWHPEWNGAQCATSHRFFEMIGGALRGADRPYRSEEEFEPVI